MGLWTQEQIDRTCFITGHRPKDLQPAYPHIKGKGFSSSDPLFIHIKETLKQPMLYLIQNEGITEFMFGGSTGIDMIAFVAAHELKQTNAPEIKLHLAIPSRQFHTRWPNETIDFFKSTLGDADSVAYVDDVPEYQFKQDGLNEYVIATIKNDKRNNYMIDSGRIGLAFWNGNKGGTGNCVRDAKKKNKTIFSITPGTHALEVINGK
jgi:uncharacterized phage-like protein YoqJ